MNESYDLIVIGGGAGGLTAARTGVRLGRSTLLVQDGPMGGDCTFTGCIPSKTLIEAAQLGLPFDRAIARVHDAVARVAAGETADVLRGEGIEVVEGRARFTGDRTLTVGGRTVRGTRVIIATGSRPTIPPGLERHDCLTNETVFDLTQRPEELAILGGGPTGCELAQAFARFGTEVTLIEQADRLLIADEPEASAVIHDALTQSGVTVSLGAEASAARVDRPLLVAVGRTPSTDGLDPEAGGVERDGRGFITTDAHLATTARGVYAVGDVTGLMLTTHAADEMARAAVGGKRFTTAAIPSVTFTDPEVARVGLSEADAAATTRGARVTYLPMTAVDRAITAGRTEGFVKLIAGPRRLTGNAGGGRLLGATIVAPRAGEMIHEVALAVRTGMFTGRLAQTVHAYPTWSMALRQAAGQFFFAVDGRQARPAAARPAVARPAANPDGQRTRPGAASGQQARPADRPAAPPADRPAR